MSGDDPGVPGFGGVRIPPPAPRPLCSAAGQVLIKAVKPARRRLTQTILEDVPVTYLMSLEYQLTGVLGFKRALQLTDPAEDWVWDENDACWRSRDPEQRLRVEKGLIYLVLIDPTQYQPGQAQAVPGEKRTGVWKITKFLRAVSRDRKAQLVENAEALLAALRQARSAPTTAAPSGRTSPGWSPPSCRAGLAGAGHPCGPGIRSRIEVTARTGAVPLDMTSRAVLPPGSVVPSCDQPTCSYSVPFTEIPFPRSPCASLLNCAAWYSGVVRAADIRRGRAEQVGHRGTDPRAGGICVGRFAAFGP